MKYEFTGQASAFLKLNDGIELTLKEGKLRVHILAADLIRVRFSCNVAFEDDFSYAVAKTNWQTNYQFTEDQEKYTLITGELKVLITKSPVRIDFLDLKDFVISQDEPAFGIGCCGTEVQAFKKIDPSEKFFGLGEKVGNLDKRGKSFRMWNTDFPAYGLRQDPLYVTIPFFIGMRQNLAYGYFLDNSYETFFDFGASQERYYSFGAKYGELNYYFFYGPDVAKVIERYTELTGRMDMPPLWSLGYQQCRWSYYPDTEVENIVRTFRDKKIPLDVIYLDIDWMDDYRVFQWHPRYFPDPKKLTASLAKYGVKVVTIIDPGIKADDSYFVAESGLKGNHFVRYPDGQIYQGEVWAGPSYFPDFSSPAARKWWGGMFKEMVETGVKGFWNDMNEPAVWGQTFPDMIEFEYEGMKKNHKAVHNVYGMLMARATYEGAMEFLNGERPLIITRAAYAGIQRYSSVWTGDNESTEEHYRLNSVMVQGLGLSGVSFAGSDVGGFEGEPSQELFARWIQLGVYTPFFRTHSIRNSKAQEPWSFGEAVESNAREMIKKRYELLPYIYTAMYHSHTKGIPVVKPLFWFYQQDETVYQEGFQYQYFFGDDIMVVAAKVSQDFTRVYLPEGDWYEMDTCIKHAGKQAIITDSTWTRLPVFVKSGAVIPMREALDYTGQAAPEKISLHIYPAATFRRISDKPLIIEKEFYEDDCHSYDYLNGQYLLRKIIVSANSSFLEILIEQEKGYYKSTIKYWDLIIYDLDKISLLTVNNRKISDFNFSNKKLQFSIKEKNSIKIVVNL